MTRVIRILSAVAIVVVLGRNLHYVLVYGRQNLGDYMAYFTHVSNLAAAGVLVSLGLFPHLTKSPTFSWIRGATTLSMCCTAVFYIWLAASPIALLKHSVGPVVMAIDWVRDRPDHLSPRIIASWSLGPFAYLVYTMLRGAVIDWYPYPMVDPRVGGYIRIGGITALMAIFSAVVSVTLAGLAPGQPGRQALMRIMRRNRLGDPIDRPVLPEQDQLRTS